MERHLGDCSHLELFSFDKYGCGALWTEVLVKDRNSLYEYLNNIGINYK